MMVKVKCLANVVKKVDEINPQLSARLVGSLINFRSYDEQRDMLMKMELEKLAGVDGVSADVFGVVEMVLE